MILSHRAASLQNIRKQPWDVPATQEGLRKYTYDPLN